MHSLLVYYDGYLLMVVRPDILQEVLERWQIHPAFVWEPDVHSAAHIAAQLAD